MIRYWLYRIGRFRTPVLFVGLALLVRWLLESTLHGSLPYAFFYAAIVLTAWNSGVWEALLSVVLGWLAAEWFFVEPQVLFSTSPEALVGDGLYFFTGLAIVWFMKAEQVALDRAVSSAVEAHRWQDKLEQERASHKEMLATHPLLVHIVETSPDASFSLTTESRILTWNAAAQKFIGYTGQEAVGQLASSILPPEERPRAEEMLRALQCGRQTTQHWQTSLNRKDGTRIPASLAASAARDAGGKVVGIAVVVRP